MIGLHDAEKHDVLVARGFNPQDLTILINLGFDYEEAQQLSTGQLGFILPNTELIDKLVALGYEREQIDCLGAFGSQAGTNTAT